MSSRRPIPYGRSNECLYDLNAAALKIATNSTTAYLIIVTIEVSVKNRAMLTIVDANKSHKVGTMNKNVCGINLKYFFPGRSGVTIPFFLAQKYCGSQIKIAVNSEMNIITVVIYGWLKLVGGQPLHGATTVSYCAFVRKDPIMAELIMPKMARTVSILSRFLLIFFSGWLICVVC